MAEIRLKQVFQSDSIGFLAIGGSTAATAAGDLSAGDGGSADLSYTASTGLLSVVAGFVRIGGATSGADSGDFAAGDGTAGDLFYDASVATLKGSNATGASWNIQFASTELTGLSGATATASSLIPAGAIVLGVTARVTTLITGATSFDIGDGSDVDRWGATVAVAATTTTTPTDYTDNTVLMQITAAGDVVLTANGSSFTAGAVRLTVAYMSLTAPTS